MKDCNVKKGFTFQLILTKKLKNMPESQHIITSKFDKVEYPDISVGEYCAKQLEINDPLSVALVGISFNIK